MWSTKEPSGTRIYENDSWCNTDNICFCFDYKNVLINDHETMNSKLSAVFLSHLQWAFQQPAYLFIVVDVFVGHACEKLFEVLSLVALPALPVCLQVCVETLHFVLAFLHLHWHLRNTDTTTATEASRGHNTRLQAYRTTTTGVWVVREFWMSGLC